MKFRPQATSTKSKTGYGRMKPQDPRLVDIAMSADKHGLKPAARLLGISATLVRRAMKLHGVQPRPVGWHMRNQKGGAK